MSNPLDFGCRCFTLTRSPAATASKRPPTDFDRLGCFYLKRTRPSRHYYRTSVTSRLGQQTYAGNVGSRLQDPSPTPSGWRSACARLDEQAYSRSGLRKAVPPREVARKSGVRSSESQGIASHCHMQIGTSQNGSSLRNPYRSLHLSVTLNVSGQVEQTLAFTE